MSISALLCDSSSSSLLISKEESDCWTLPMTLCPLGDCSSLLLRDDESSSSLTGSSGDLGVVTLSYYTPPRASLEDSLSM